MRYGCSKGHLPDVFGGFILFREETWSKVITRAKGNKIIALLKGTCNDSGHHLKFWVKSRKFSLMSYPALGLSDVLCLPARKKVSIRKM